jgi:hypothetical protein
MDNEKVREIINKFENDDFIGSKELLQQEIRKAKDTYLKDKLGLKGNTEED